MASFETFKLSELRLDENNYRTGPVNGQRAAIEAIIADQGQKLVNLAKDILEMGGLSPGEPLWVYRDTASGTYVVVEGNRRITALKLMDNPLLADGTTVEKEFRALSARFAGHPIREITATVFPSFEAAAPWRRRRHLTSGSGVGLEGWKTLAKARADRDHGEKARRVLTVVEYLQDSSAEWEAIKDALDPRWTTVERVLNAAPMKSVLGVHIDTKTGQVTFENGNEAAGRKLLKSILGTMASAGFEFSEVEQIGHREAFLNRFSGLSVKSELGPKGVPPVQLPSQASRFVPPAPQRKGKVADDPVRKTLAPAKGVRTFPVNGTRLKAIYDECKKLTVVKNENAAALLLRVFIELSTEALLSEKGKLIPTKFTKKGAVEWDDIGIPLAAKVQVALEELDPSNKGKAFQKVRVALDDQSHGLASINTLHGYFHNRRLTPEAPDLMGAWDTWEPYLSALHGAR